MNVITLSTDINEGVAPGQCNHSQHRLPARDRTAVLTSSISTNLFALKMQSRDR
eukprot:CAMPEP_0118936566 /NCGR_PEP_ID=MMETSP1169-20130426/19502_1 /TAXON_ID=36882 /ORGANISM="Pyramimonas obovata, Strain CCMP722" /LENGTH=53 /DNA_ID=CAMNT_0006879871 /DNA_START=167 /DNA_END=328 /DNA_ORIENTATION=+